jgi:hypothetical protein
MACFVYSCCRGNRCNRSGNRNEKKGNAASGLPSLRALIPPIFQKKINPPGQRSSACLQSSSGAA